ncbi:Endoglucanase [Tolypocladium paradoxum]|uniref:Endoglucanase n=1 Tax=Tolypocladium paradoxum TaxID=94208 RepID=A0A2S4KM11_9HYPO|nr:Endoglucanase [Tolypocladium paradoxum]
MAGGVVQLPGPFVTRSHCGYQSARRRGDATAEALPLFSLPATQAATASVVGDGYDADIETFAWARPKRSRSQRLLRSSRRAIARSPCTMFLLVVALLVVGCVGYMWRRENALNARWVPDAASLKFSQEPLPSPLERTSITEYELPLRTRGRHIVDARGRRFKLASINWYGASDELFVPGGLDIQHRTKIAETIKRMGFNSVRLPYADELVTSNPVVDGRLVMANPDLAGLRAMDILEAVTTALTDAGIAVIINNHITSATWCCGADPCDAGWANDHLGPLCRVKQTEEQWIRNWEDVMERFVENPLVIGVDLRNEVRGLWGTMPWAKWAEAAERCGNRLLRMKPDWLVVVEGTESANDLSGARKRPVRLDVANKLVYSAHVYSWSGWGSLGGRFAQRSYSSFVRTMRYNWAYLLEQDMAPVWVGELGAPHCPSVGDAHYWQNLWRFLKAIDADFGYWALNARKPKDNARETYSLVADDWLTPLRDYRMKDMSELMQA